jgi:hypothetical protein
MIAFDDHQVLTALLQDPLRERGAS